MHIVFVCTEGNDRLSLGNILRSFTREHHHLMCQKYGGSMEDNLRGLHVKIRDPLCAFNKPYMIKQLFRKGVDKCYKGHPPLASFELDFARSQPPCKLK